MAKEGSVAPKERVNVVYKPATGDAQEEVELPLKLLVMSDFTLKEDETPIEDRKAINVDKDNFKTIHWYLRVLIRLVDKHNPIQHR